MFPYLIAGAVIGAGAFLAGRRPILSTGGSS
jgi:hypothetical protein